MFYSEDVEIIRELINNKHVDLYDLHLKYCLSPAQVSRSVRRFIVEGIVVSQDNVIELTDYGKEWIILNRKELFLDDSRKYWKQESQDSRYKEDDMLPYEYTLEILKIIEEGED